MKNKAFTLIELLVVIAIIGLIAAIVTASINSARSKARDAIRKTDLKNVSLALEMYYAENGTYSVSGYGYQGTGRGWLSYRYSSTYLPITTGLVNAGFLSKEIIDPSGITNTDGVSNSGYMIDADNIGYTLWANLENPSDADRSTQSTCRHSTYDNYPSGSDMSIRMNYCISN